MIINKKIVLLGYMGSGKSSIAKLISKKIDLMSVDLDNYIEKKENKSISDIFEINGELYFRKIENKYLRDLLDLENYKIISIGGGTPCYHDNIKLMIESKCIVFYLRANVDTLADRLFNEKYDRPLISKIKFKKDLRTFISKHLFERNQFYLKSNFIIDVDEKTEDEISNECIKLLS
tara:strand:+ start:22224 stop:22754 length:531 start_codon:yes stop_codon:yes gene_type:complete